MKLAQTGWAMRFTQEVKFFANFLQTFCNPKNSFFKQKSYFFKKNVQNKKKLTVQCEHACVASENLSGSAGGNRIQEFSKTLLVSMLVDMHIESS